MSEKMDDQVVLQDLHKAHRQAQRICHQTEQDWDEARREVDVVFDRMMSAAEDGSTTDLGKAIDKYGEAYNAARALERELRIEYFAAIERECAAWDRIVEHWEKSSTVNT